MLTHAESVEMIANMDS